MSELKNRIDFVYIFVCYKMVIQMVTRMQVIFLG